MDRATHRNHGLSRCFHPARPGSQGANGDGGL